MKLLKQIFKAGEDLIYPEGIRCHLCGEDLEGHEHPPHCSSCSVTIYRIEGALCFRCGKPLEGAENAYVPYGLKCTSCQEQFSYIQIHRSFGHYKDGLKKMLMDLKYKERIDHVPHIGQMLSQVIYETYELQEIDLVIPVPIHYTRRLSRGYNQSELLARELADMFDSFEYLNALKRHKRTVKLKKLDKEARKDALHNAIIMNKHALPTIRGKKVMLVDDIYTTGTTLEACAKVLYESGCASVYAVTLAMGY